MWHHLYFDFLCGLLRCSTEVHSVAQVARLRIVGVFECFHFYGQYLKCTSSLSLITIIPLYEKCGGNIYKNLLSNLQFEHINHLYISHVQF